MLPLVVSKRCAHFGAGEGGGGSEFSEVLGLLGEFCTALKRRGVGYYWALSKKLPKALLQEIGKIPSPSAKTTLIGRFFQSSNYSGSLQTT